MVASTFLSFCKKRMSISPTFDIIESIICCIKETRTIKSIAKGFKEDDPYSI